MRRRHEWSALLVHVERQLVDVGRRRPTCQLVELDDFVRRHRPHVIVLHLPQPQREQLPSLKHRHQR